MRKEPEGGRVVEAYVGVDWGSEVHAVCVLDPQGHVLGERTFAHDGPGLSAMVEWLNTFAEGDATAVWVGIEVPHGAVVEALLERGFAVFSLNPKQMDRFRDRFTVAGSKDDRFDAHVVADSLRTDARCFRRLRADQREIIELREWSRMAEELQQERIRLSNRIREQLRRYYPQMLKLNVDVSAPWWWAVWSKAPTPAQARRVRETTLARILKEHRIRKWNATELLQVLREPAVVLVPGTVEAAVAHIELLIERLRVVDRQWRQTHQRIDGLCQELTESGDDEPGQRIGQRDVEVLSSLPGVGRIVLAALLAEAAWALRARDYHALRALGGVAPVTRNSGKRSGKRSVVVMRYACSQRVRVALYHLARTAMQNDVRSRERYAALRAKGHSHGRALRSVADRLLYVMCAMLRDGTTYDPGRARAVANAA